MFVGSQQFRRTLKQRPIDPETEENTFLALPRNLSYVQESHLDRHSVSARFVHNPKVDHAQQLFEDQRLLRDNAENVKEGSGVDDEDDDGDFQNNTQIPDCYSSTGFDFSSYLQNQKPAPSSPIAVTKSPKTRQKLQSPDGAALASPGTRSFMSRVAVSRLASFLSPKEQQTSLPSSDYDQDFGSSVDNPLSPADISRPTSCMPLSSLPNSSQVHSPDRRGLTMDRGEDIMISQHDEHVVSSNVPLTLSSPSEIFHIEEVARDLEEEEMITVVLEGDTDLQPQQTGIISTEQDSNTDNGDQAVKSFTTSGKTIYPTIECHEYKPSPTLTIAHEKDQTFKGQSTKTFESPDSDAFSEEGVFVNMMDDFDNNEKSTTVSEVSDDTCVSVDSMFLSPDEDELEEEKTSKDSSDPPRMSMEEAISRAASDLSKMSMMMYPDLLDSPLSDRNSGGEKGTENHPKFSRTSVVRQTTGLTIHLSHENISSNKKEFELPESPVYEEHEFNFNKKGLRKSSSLKTNKTPPGTPHRKKVVRFADAMGLDLESVRHVLNMESPPRIPASAMADLKQGLGEDRKDIGFRYLCPCFTQPGATEGFMRRVSQQKVCLENAIITDLTITGFVRVSNIAYHKNVRVRYTHNNWSTFHDIAACYVLNSSDGSTDRFSFSIVAPAYFVPGNRLEFAVSFNAEGSEYWDNNGGKNYAFECFAKTVPTENESAWMHFL